MNLADAADLGSFLGGVATTLGLLGLIGVWLQWHSNKEQEKKAEVESASKIEMHRERRAAEANRSARNEVIAQEIAILSWAHEAFASMVYERHKLYLEGFSKENENPARKGYAVRAAAKLNAIFAYRLKSWIQTLGSLDRGALDIQQLELLVASCAAIAEDDFRLIKHFASEEFEELISLKDKIDGTEEGTSDVLKKVSELDKFGLSPLDHQKSSNAIFSELAESWHELKSKHPKNSA